MQINSCLQVREGMEVFLSFPKGQMQMLLSSMATVLPGTAITKNQARSMSHEYYSFGHSA